MTERRSERRTWAAVSRPSSDQNGGPLKGVLVHAHVRTSVCAHGRAEVGRGWQKARLKGDCAPARKTTLVKLPSVQSEGPWWGAPWAKRAPEGHSSSPRERGEGGESLGDDVPDEGLKHNERWP